MIQESQEIKLFGIEVQSIKVISLKECLEDFNATYISIEPS
jgi:hypothetical protein